jgi:hypothetical protein
MSYTPSIPPGHERKIVSGDWYLYRDPYLHLV